MYTEFIRDMYARTNIHISPILFVLQQFFDPMCYEFYIACNLQTELIYPCTMKGNNR